MSSAAFVLTINIFVAGLFAMAFTVVATNARTATGARWLALAYGAGVVNIGLEIILPFQQDPRAVGIGIFLAFLLAQAFSVVGLARNYEVAPPWRWLAALVIASVIDIFVIIDLDRGAFWRAMLYQLPYALMQVLGMMVVLRARRRQALDIALLVIYALGCLHFLAKPFVASVLGSGSTAQDYIGTTYAAISQTVGAVLLIANGILMLVIILRDTMTEMRTQSATDPLSGLLNRRGFEELSDRLLSQARREGVPVAVVIADLDHFKAINDSYGHAVGDVVISRFSDTLRQAAELGAKTVPQAVLGRLGGEEFAVLAPGSGMHSAQLFAERVRTLFASQYMAELAPSAHPSASFGVAQLRGSETLSEMLCRADAALYRAKQGGRDRICLADSSAEMAPATLRAARDVQLS